MSQFENVNLSKSANIYFDGKCISYSLTLQDGSKKSVGVIQPASLTFNTAAPEIMELVAGSCRVRLPGQEWQEFGAGEQFNVPADSAFDIEVTETLHYICHYG